MRELKERLLSKTNKINNCVEFQGYVDPNGYGKIGVNGKVEYAHRASWFLHFGPIPEGLFVCHKCDNRRCVKPSHLFLGTAKDNMQDAVKKKRMKTPKRSYYSDERHQPAKLTNDQVRYIRSNNISSTILGKKFGVDSSTIRYARRGKTFRGVK